MDFELSDDQLALQSAASSLLESTLPISRVRQVADSGAAYDQDLWQAIAEQGWLGVDSSEEEGGLGAGAVEVAILAEQAGRHLAPVPFLETLLTRSAISEALTSGTASSGDVLGGVSLGEWVARLSRGDAVGAPAWSSDVAAVRARTNTRPKGIPAPGADTSGSDEAVFSLEGRPDPVVYGCDADVVVVAARECLDGELGEVGLFALAQARDSRPAPEERMDRTRRIAWLELNGVPALRLGGSDLVCSLTDRAATFVSAQMLGSANRVLEMAIQYAKDRVQFGRPIGSFQAVKHRLADMLVDVEGMRSIAYYAAWCVGQGGAESSTAASSAKIWCSDASRRVMASGLQVHGGIGFTWEHDLHLFLKRAQLDQVSFGDATWHRDRLARILRARVGSGEPLM